MFLLQKRFWGNELKWRKKKKLKPDSKEYEEVGELTELAYDLRGQGKKKENEDKWFVKYVVLMKQITLMASVMIAGFQ